MKNKNGKSAKEGSSTTTDDQAMLEHAVISSARQLPAKREPLSAEKLRTFPGCERYSDTEAEEIVLTIRALAKILLGIAA